MALNTRSKRASSVGLMLACVLSPVLPDGTISPGDRQHIALTYSGISSAVSSTGFLITQEVVEVAYTLTTPARLTQEVLEVVHGPNPPFYLTQLVVEVLWLAGEPPPIACVVDFPVDAAPVRNGCVISDL